MEDTKQTTILAILNRQREYFAAGHTRSVDFRLEMLRKFKKAILDYEERIAEALWKDLRKSPEETFLTEISIVTQEIDHHIRHLRRWARSKKVRTPLHLLPSSSRIQYEPLGLSLIMAAWNYPFQLLMNPLVGSISAGNCALLKPSPYTENTALVMEDLIRKTFDEGYINLVQGGRKTNTYLFEQRFDFIFYTGSSYVGRIVMKAASEHLTPVILELGGKSPCIVDRDANLDVAARRIAWGKTINSGQTCVGPDYLFAHESIKDELVSKIGMEISRMYGKDIRTSRHYPRIVNSAAFERLEKLMLDGKVVYGGQTNAPERFIAPTILDRIKPDDAIMQDEIFGPLLPVMTFSSMNEVYSYLASQEKPLAFYYFGKNKKAKEVLANSTSGGGCINDTLMHLVNHHLPFGGVGNSGMGRYHGRNSFLAFSNARAIVSTPTWIDLKFKYVPYPNFKLLRRILK